MAGWLAGWVLAYLQQRWALNQIQQGHLIGEYQADGKPLQETVWLGDLPIAVISPSAAGSSINYILADHLGTPRQISDPANGKLIWRWDGAY